jgi:hypothetical protein
MTRAIAIVIAVGAVIGTVGGLIAGENWISIGGLVLVLGVGALYAIGILRNPLGVARAEADVEAAFSGYPVHSVKPEQQQSTRIQQESRPPLPSNSTLHTDARSGSVPEDPPPARAGERGR